MQLLELFESRLPDHCEPSNHFLYLFSATWATCVPTNLAFLSIVLGTISIAAWLFAQLPQIIKNYNAKSTSGLSIFFLVEWCLGDMSNFAGAMMTGQAAWQVIIGAYYCFVDVTLVSQWFWYEHLHHGRRLRSMWKKVSRRRYDDDGTDDEEFFESYEHLVRDANERASTPLNSGTTPRDVPVKSQETQGLFRGIVYGSAPKEQPGSPASDRVRTFHRVPNRSLPSPSPRAILFISLLIAFAQASPLATSTAPGTSSTSSLTDILGPLISWCSTLLYLGSRLPQLLKNHRRRSTAGLSLALFMAAFTGNLFYSLSLLFNPLAWASYPAYGCRGWVRAEPSNQVQWVGAATPFFLGAAGVLLMDAAVGVQFWVFREPAGEPREVLVVRERRRDGWKWMEVDGWMRGWKPSLSSGRASPVGEVDGADRRGYGTM